MRNPTNKDLYTVIMDFRQEFKEELALLHTKFENIDKLVAVHEQRLNDHDKKMDGALNKSWGIISIIFGAIIGATVGFIMKK